jgi:hypothetical protein
MPVFNDDGGAPPLLLVLRPLARPPLLLRVLCCWAATIIFFTPRPFALAPGGLDVLWLLLWFVRVGALPACLVFV